MYQEIDYDGGDSILITSWHLELSNKRIRTFTANNECARHLLLDRRSEEEQQEISYWNNTNYVIKILSESVIILLFLNHNFNYDKTNYLYIFINKIIKNLWFKNNKIISGSDKILIT